MVEQGELSSFSPVCNRIYLRLSYLQKWGGIYINDGRWGRRWVDGDGINADTRRSTLIITNHVKMVYNESGLYCIVPVSEVIVWTSLRENITLV